MKWLENCLRNESLTAILVIRVGPWCVEETEQEITEKIHETMFNYVL